MFLKSVGEFLISIFVYVNLSYIRYTGVYVHSHVVDHSFTEFLANFVR